MIFNSVNEKIFFYTFPVYLFSLIPFFLITGPFLSDLAISLVALIFLAYCYKRNDYSYFKNRYFYIFLIFWIYLVFNSLFNNLNFDSLKISIFYFRYGVFVIAIITLLGFNDGFVKYFFYCIFICFVVLIFDGFYQYFFGENILGWKSSVRVSSFFGEEKILGSYLSRLWPIFFGLSIFYLKKKDKLFFLFILVFIFSEALIFLSGDRSAFFNINLSAIFVILLSQKLFKLRLITLCSSIVLLLIISFINPTAKERVFDQTIKQMNLQNSNQDDYKNIYIFSKEHTHHYITAYRMYLDNKIFGVGVKNFRKFCKNEKYSVSELSCASHPHNTYVQVLSEIGITGFIFLISILFYFCFNILKHLILRFKGKSYFSDFEICLLSVIAIYLWPFIPTGNIFNNWLNIALILNLPFLFWAKKLANS
ncbi:O-antigen ligase family protein [Candidatus Pelagibacter sp. HIMB1587]|uniref:O-antigen ligase family protein n=1 Tax=Candidatus Pelagibacter sp. HIMB1587 TaxID=3413354 RepID=UPI003F834EF3